MARSTEEAKANTKTEENPEHNPRKAATKLKEMQLNVEMMRNRFKVLEGQNQYNRYLTLDQSKRIEHHNSIHERISKEKEQLKKSLEKMSATSELKEKNDQLRLQIRDRIKEARKSVMDNKLEMSQLVVQEFNQNEQRIKEYKEQDVELNRSKKNAILQYHEQKRENIKQHLENKIKTTLFGKSKDSRYLSIQADSLNKELESMMEYQKKLVHENSQSLQASQVMKSKFKDVLCLSERSPSYKLPQIRSKTNASKQTNNSDLL